ncbi:hypothetical protein [Tropicimonas marinistellae]|uniref:hypothetical protein n=1 Tax=Tropicimonas marinistellae TaxID=1739787 RepID=UPI00082D5F15|nr:hypothetical protein [Tropicimonas marinistellae]
MAAEMLPAQKLFAPFDGQISAPRYRENANVNIDDSREIATPVQLNPIHIRAPVPLQRVVSRMREGEKDADVGARISVDLILPDGRKYEHKGQPLTASYDLAPASGAAVVLIEFPNPDRILRLGKVVRLTGYES